MSNQNQIGNYDPEIYFARHGQSMANVDGYLAGGSDSELTGLGWEEAHELARHVHDSDIGIDTIISSPQQRALGTAGIVAAKIGISPKEIVVLDELRERGGGSYEGGPLDRFYEASDLEVAAAGGESFDAFADRMQRAHEKVHELAMHRGPTLVIGHAEGNRMLGTISLGLPPHAMPALPKSANARIEPFRQIPKEAVLPVYRVHKGVIQNRPQNGWVLTGLKNPMGELTELAEVPVGTGTGLRRGDEVAVAVDTRGLPEFNQLVRSAASPRRKQFASRR